MEHVFGGKVGSSFPAACTPVRAKNTVIKEKVIAYCCSTLWEVPVNGSAVVMTLGAKPLTTKRKLSCYLTVTDFGIEPASWVRLSDGLDALTLVLIDYS